VPSDPLRYLAMWISHLGTLEDQGLVFFLHSGDDCQSSVCVVADPRSCQHLCVGI